MKSLIGKIHSIETCGTVDGPGIRYVLFMQGCPLKCQYCHNPDSWDISKGISKSVDEIFEDLLKYKSYMNFSKGGLTVSGGEPLLQAKFLIDLIGKCKAAGIHTAIDTSGYINNEHAKEALRSVDLVLLDIKNYNPKTYQEITGVSLQPTLDTLDYLQEINKAVIIRYVLVPGLSDNFAYIEKLAKHLSSFTNILQIELLPFHKLGEFKWEELNLPYLLTNTVEPSDKLKESVVSIFKKNNHKIVVN